MVFQSKNKNNRSKKAAEKIVEKLFALIKSFVKKQNDKMKYKRKTDFSTTLAWGLRYTEKGVVQTTATNRINKLIENGAHTSNYSKRINKIDKKIFDQLLCSLCDFDNENFKFDEEIIAVDGSHTQVVTPDPKKMQSGITDFKENPSGGSVNLPILGVYNVTRSLPVTLELAKTKNERQAFKNFLTGDRRKLLDTFINKIVVFDRGYPSHDMMRTLERENIKFVFRLPESWVKTKKNNKGKRSKRTTAVRTNPDAVSDIIKTYGQKDKIEIRHVHYRIDGIDYYLGTNLRDIIKYPVAALKLIYHKRWSVEEYFNIIKDKMKAARYATNKLNTVEVSMCMQQIMTTILSIMIKAYRPEDNGTYCSAVNARSMLDIIYDIFIPEIGSSSDLVTQGTITIISNSVNYVPIINGRHFPHQSKTRYTKWYYAKYETGTKRSIKMQRKTEAAED